MEEMGLPTEKGKKKDLEEEREVQAEHRQGADRKVVNRWKEEKYPWEKFG